MSEKELNKNYIKGIILASKNNEELLVNEIQELCSKQYIRGLKQGKFDATMDMQEQLKQRDEVIEKAIDFCNYLIENNEVEIDNEKYFKQSCDDIITLAILKKLQKYKGDNK